MTCFAVVFEDSCWVLVDRWYCRPNSRLRQFRRWSEQAHGHGLEVLNDGGEMELVAGAGKAAQPHAFESMMRLQVGKAHLDPLPLIARFQEGLRLHLAASDVARRLVDAPHNPARGHVRTESLLGTPASEARMRSIGSHGRCGPGHWSSASRLPGRCRGCACCRT